MDVLLSVPLKIPFNLVGRILVNIKKFVFDDHFRYSHDVYILIK